MPREVNPPRAYASPLPVAGSSAAKKGKTARRSTSANASSSRLASSSTTTAEAATSLSPSITAVPTTKAKTARKSTAPVRKATPPSRSSILAASTFNLPLPYDDALDSLLSTDPLLAPPRYAARISLVDRLTFPSSVTADGGSSPVQAYSGPLTPPDSQESFEAAPVAAVSARKKARDSGFVGSDEAGEEDAYAAMIVARDRSRPAQPSPPASAPVRRAFSHAPQSPLKSSLARARKRTPSMLNSPSKGPGTDANASPNPKARKQARASAAPGKALSDHRFAFSTPGAGPSRRPMTGPRTERPAKKSTLSQSTKAAAAQRRKSAPTSLPKGVPIVRTATDPNMPSPPPSPSDDPILLRGAERIRYLDPSSGADAAREIQAQQDAEQEDELGLSVAVPVPQEKQESSQPPRLASLDQSSDKETDAADDDYWGGGMDAGGFEVHDLGPSSGSDNDDDGDDDPDNTFYSHSKSSGVRQELRLSDLDSLLALRAAPPPAAVAPPSSRGTTPQAAPPQPPTPPPTASFAFASASTSQRPRSVSATPTPPSSSPASRRLSPSATPLAADQHSTAPRDASMNRLEVSPTLSADGSSLQSFDRCLPPMHELSIATTPCQLDIRPSVALTPFILLAAAESPSTTPLAAPTFTQPPASLAGSPVAHVPIAEVKLTEAEVAVQEPAVIRIFAAPAGDSPPRSASLQSAVSGTPLSQRVGPTSPSSAATPSQVLEPLDTPAPTLSPYVFGPPRTPESYSGSEPDEESQARHSLVPDRTGEDGNDATAADAPRSDDSVFDELDRQWEARNQTLDALGWAARVRSSLSPDSSDAEDEPEPAELGWIETTLAEKEPLESEAVEVEAVESKPVEVQTIGCDSDHEPVAPDAVQLELVETFSPKLSSVEPGPLTIEPELSSSVSVDPKLTESAAEPGLSETVPELNQVEASLTPSGIVEPDALAPARVGLDADADEAGSALDPPSGLDSEEEEVNGTGSTAGDSDRTQAAIDGDGDGSSIIDDDRDSFFGEIEIEQKSLLEELADDDDLDVLDVTSGAFDHQTDQLAEFRDFVNTVDEPEVQSYTDLRPHAHAPTSSNDDDEIVTVEVVSSDGHQVVPIAAERGDDPVLACLEDKRQPAELLAAERPLAEADRLFDEEVQLYTETGRFFSENSTLTAFAIEEAVDNEELPTDAAPPVEAVTADLPIEPSAEMDAPEKDPRPKSASLDADEPVEQAVALAPVETEAADRLLSSSRRPQTPSPARLPLPSLSPVRVGIASTPVPRCVSVADATGITSTSRSSGDDTSLDTASVEPWVKVSSNDPRQAARATAFLKLFHDYIEAEADPDTSSTSTARDRSTASRLSSLNTSYGRSDYLAADSSVCSVADDLLMEAEQEIALETDVGGTAPTAAAEADMSADETELAIPGSFTRVERSLASSMGRPAIVAVVVDRPWGPAEWRALMDSLDAVGPDASSGAVLERFMLRSRVAERDLQGEWSRPKLLLRLASIQQRRSNEAARPTKRRRSHHPQKTLLAPHKAASAALSRPSNPGRRSSTRMSSSRSTAGVSGSAALSSSSSSTAPTAMASLADRVLSFLNVIRREPVPPPPAFHSRTSIPEFEMAPPPIVPGTTPKVIPPSSAAAAAAAAAVGSRRGSAGRQRALGRSERSTSPAAQPMMAPTSSGSARRPSSAVRSIAIPRPSSSSSSSSTAVNLSTSLSSTHSSVDGSTLLPIISQPGRRPFERSERPPAAAAAAAALHPRSSFEPSPPNVEALVRSFERARAMSGQPLQQQHRQPR